MGMVLEVRAVAPFYKNGFVVGCDRTHDAIVIDPGDEAEQLIDAARHHSLTVRYILLTHAHVDHITGVGRAKSAFKAPVYLHRDDLPFYEHAVEQGQMFGLTVRQPPPVDVFYDESPIRFGDYEVRVHHTPGHCPGGVCLEVIQKGGRGKGEGGSGGGGRGDREAVPHLFVGDTLFAGTIGRTDLPGGNYDVLMRSITQVLFALGDDATVHPGHGPDTTIHHERTRNPFVLAYLASKP
jgi:glyoxylase-like metal-dependent hydrolase (beta-lactamase superfamily II)